MEDPGLRLLHGIDGHRRIIDPGDVFYLEAEGDDSLVRFRAKEPFRDVRKLGALEEVFSRFGFFRVHERWLVNLRRCRELRPREGGDWDAVLEPPVNRVIPVARGRRKELFAVFGE